MQLKDGVLAVRNRLRELNPWLYTNGDIIKDLNTSAGSMVSKAQSLRAVWQGQTQTPYVNALGQQVGQQEYELPLDVDNVICVRIQIGILMQMAWASQELLQEGAYITSLPLMAYLKRGILQSSLIPVVSNSGEIIQPPASPAGIVRWIVGFSPIPSQVYNFFVDYYQYHPTMKNPDDMVLLPPETDILDGWYGYAVAKGMEKKGDMVSADYYMKQHTAGAEALKTKTLVDTWQVNPGMYGGPSSLINRSPSVLVIPPINPTIQHG